MGWNIMKCMLNYYQKCIYLFNVLISNINFFNKWQHFFPAKFCPPDSESCSDFCSWKLAVGILYFDQGMSQSVSKILIYKFVSLWKELLKSTFF